MGLKRVFHTLNRLFSGSNIAFFGPFNVIFQAWPRFVHSFGLILALILYFPPEMRSLFKLFGKMIEKPAPERQKVQANRSVFIIIPKNDRSRIPPTGFFFAFVYAAARSV